MQRWVVAAMLFLIGSAAHADTCFSSSDPWKVYSSDGHWRLAVDPRPAFSGEAKGPRATLYRKTKLGWSRQARWSLLNSPAGTVLTKDGRTVTLDTGCHSGYGDTVVVIYGPDGKVIRNLGLNDILLPEDIESFSRTVSSIQWAGTHRVDEEKRQIILQANGRPRMVELPISLEDGSLLYAKKRYFQRSFLSASVSYGAAPDAISEVAKCDRGVAVSTSELLSLVSEPIFPVYPPIALKARVHGNIVVEVAVNESGTVDSAVVIKSLPFGLDAAALAAAHQWRFRPAQRDRQSVAMCGRFSLNFTLVPVDPTPPD